MIAQRPRPDEAAGRAGAEPVSDRSDYDGSRAPTGMANGNDDSRLARGIDR